MEVFSTLAALALGAVGILGPRFQKSASAWRVASVRALPVSFFGAATGGRGSGFGMEMPEEPSIASLRTPAVFIWLVALITRPASWPPRTERRFVREAQSASPLTTGCWKLSRR